MAPSPEKEITPSVMWRKRVSSLLTENGFLDVIISETDRMTRIVQDLLTRERALSTR